MGRYPQMRRRSLTAGPIADGWARLVTLSSPTVDRGVIGRQRRDLAAGGASLLGPFRVGLQRGRTEALPAICPTVGPEPRRDDCRSPTRR